MKKEDYHIMKKTYEKPFAQKVAFSYQDQVMAQSGHTGQIYNRDNTGHCQAWAAGCNYAWRVQGGISTAGLDDCAYYPGTDPVE